MIRLESWGSKFVFRDTRNRLPPGPLNIRGRHPVGLFINYTDNTWKWNIRKTRNATKASPKKGATEKLTYRVAVKLAAADYFRLMTRAYEAGVSSSEYMRECFRNGHVKGRLSEEHAAHVRNLCGIANN